VIGIATPLFCITCYLVGYIVSIPACPQCKGEYAYVDQPNYVCPECGFEWAVDGQLETVVAVTDVNGQVLSSGDYVTVIKDLKVKGSSSVVKVGTKIKCGRIDTDAKDHEIDCKVPSVGAMKLTAKFTKKVQ